MSDIGLFPPGAGVWLLSLGWSGISVVGLLICLLLAWRRSRNRSMRFTHDRFFGWAIGAATSGIATGLSMGLVDWSNSLGAFARWLDQSAITISWLGAQAALWPIVALLWNRRIRGKAARNGR